MTDLELPGAWRKTRSQIAVEARLHPERDRSVLVSQLRAQRLADHIRESVDAAPPLDPDTRARLALLLSGGAA